MPVLEFSKWLRSEDVFPFGKFELDYLGDAADYLGEATDYLTAVAKRRVVEDALIDFKTKSGLSNQCRSDGLKTRLVKTCWRLETH